MGIAPIRPSHSCGYPLCEAHAYRRDSGAGQAHLHQLPVLGGSGAVHRRRDQR